MATVTVQVNAPAPVTTTYTNSTSASIPDQGTRLSTIVISDAYAIRDINVRLNITHTRDSDLRVFLRGPDGTVIELFSNIGGTGRNFTIDLRRTKATARSGENACKHCGFRVWYRCIAFAEVNNTVLDDEANKLITTGSAPFTGAFKPVGNLSLLEGKNVIGTWTLEVRDTVKRNTGTLTSWSLTIEH